MLELFLTLHTSSLYIGLAGMTIFSILKMILIPYIFAGQIYISRAIIWKEIKLSILKMKLKRLVSYTITENLYLALTKDMLLVNFTRPIMAFKQRSNSSFTIPTLPTVEPMPTNSMSPL